MSNLVLTWVFHESPTSGTPFNVLLAIADEADDDGFAHPALERIAKKARCSMRSAARGIVDLEQMGELLVKRPERRGRGHFNRYVVVRGRDLAEAAACLHANLTPFTPVSAPRETGRKVAESGSVVANPSQTHRPIDPLPELRLVSEVESSVADTRERDIRCVFDAWLESTGRTGRTILDDKRRRLILKALHDYPLADVLDAVRGWKHSSHHRGDVGAVYNDLGLVLRDAEHIERMRDFARQPSEARRTNGTGKASPGTGSLAFTPEKNEAMRREPSGVFDAKAGR